MGARAARSRPGPGWLVGWALALVSGTVLWPARAHAQDEIFVANGNANSITIYARTAAGNTAPRANNEIAFSIEGPGEIVATDNGDPTSFTPFASHRRAAFNGYALAIVRGAPGEAGEIRVQAVSPGLGSAVVIIQSAPGR